MVGFKPITPFSFKTEFSTGNKKKWRKTPIETMSWSQPELLLFIFSWKKNTHRERNPTFSSKLQRKQTQHIFSWKKNTKRVLPSKKTDTPYFFLEKEYPEREEPYVFFEASKKRNTTYFFLGTGYSKELGKCGNQRHETPQKSKYNTLVFLREYR